MHGGGKGNGALSAANKALTEPTDPALRSLRNYTELPDPRGRLRLVRHLVGDRAVAAQRAAELAGVRPRPARRGASCRCCTADCCGASPEAGDVIALIAGLAVSARRHDHGRAARCRRMPTMADKDPNDRSYGVMPRQRCRLGSWSRRCLAWAFLAPVWFRAVAADRPRAAPFLSWTFAPVSLGAFAVLVAGYVIAALTLEPQALGGVRLEHRTAGPSAPRSARSCCISARRSASRCRPRRLPCSGRSGSSAHRCCTARSMSACAGPPPMPSSIANGWHG